MKRFIGPIFLAATFSLFLTGCGGDSGDDGNTDSTSSSQTCESTHECINDVCECTTDGKSGNSCEKDSCESDCEVCS